MDLIIKNKNTRNRFLDELKTECKLRARRADMDINEDVITINIYDKSIEYAVKAAAETAYLYQDHLESHFAEDEESLNNIRFL